MLYSHAPGGVQIICTSPYRLFKDDKDEMVAGILRALSLSFSVSVSLSQVCPSLHGGRWL